MTSIWWFFGGVLIGWCVAQGIIEVVRARQRKRSWDEFRARQDRRATAERARG